MDTTHIYIYMYNILLRRLRTVDINMIFTNTTYNSTRFIQCIDNNI